jgi:spermidine/putrescine transport system ATP-binding protein
LSIEAEGLACRFGDVQALSHISLAVRRGEFFSLLGPSGCGKTTLLRIIAGLEHPDAGTLKLGGVNALDIPAHQRHVNTVFQSYALFPHLDVQDNVAFGLRMRKVPEAACRERVQRMLELVEISDLAGRRPAQLSGGQKQRVALARAVVNEPDVLLLDEPLGALDLKLRKQLQLELHQLQRRLGITFIYVTHDQDEALVLSDRIAVMRAGQIEQSDTPENLYEKPRTEFVARFLGSCNILPSTWLRQAGSHAFFETPLGVLAGEAAIFDPARISRAVNLAVRPEKIHLGADESTPADNCFKASIVDVVYSGSERHYKLQVGKGSLAAVSLNTRAGGQGFNTGDVVICRIEPGAVVVLED